MRRLVVLILLLAVAAWARPDPQSLQFKMLPGGSTGPGIVVTYAPCMDNDMIREPGVAVSVSTYQPPSGYSTYDGSNIHDATDGGSPNYCDRVWRTYDEPVVPGDGVWPHAEWPWIKIYFPTARRIGQMSWMHRGADPSRGPEYILLYGGSNVEGPWHWIWEWEMPRLWYMNSCTWETHDGRVELEIPSVRCTNTYQFFLVQCVDYGPWGEQILQCANLELWEATVNGECD